MPLLFLLISFLASIIGSICGIGGGILIKPVLEMVGAASVSTISFLSSCTVLSMSLYNVGRSQKSGRQEIDLSVATPLAIGAALGGILGGATVSGPSGGVWERQHSGRCPVSVSSSPCAGNAALFFEQEPHSADPFAPERCLRRHWPDPRFPVQFSGDRRWPLQSGCAALLSQSGNKKSRCEFPIHHSSQSGCQSVTSADPGHRSAL